jgi:hypothetical protein
VLAGTITLADAIAFAGTVISSTLRRRARQCLVLCFEFG